MDRTQRARERIPQIMRTFPSVSCGIYRRTVDDYGSETGEETLLGTVAVWLEGVNRPSKWQLSDRAAIPVEDMAKWGAVLREATTPAVQIGDAVQLPDGSRRRIRSIVPDGVSAREFWLLTEG